MTNRKHRVKLGSAKSDWISILSGVPQGSILGPLIFNIFINDLFLFIKRSDICNFADDNTLYKCGPNLSKIFKCIEEDMVNTLTWFKVNSLKANPKKFQFMVLGTKENREFKLNMNGASVMSKKSVKLLGITIDNKLTFTEHIDHICKSASYKLFALKRIRKYLTTKQAETLANAFINSQFNYCSLIWMFSGKRNLNKIHNIHKRTLRVVYKEYDKSYEELLRDHNTTSIHQNHVKFLATEIFKSINKLNPEFMWQYFSVSDTNYMLRSGSRLNIPQANSTKYGINSLVFRSAFLWNALPNSLKTCESLDAFKLEIKKETQLPCNCPACRF